MSTETLHDLSTIELKSKLNKELSSKNPNYELVSIITNILSQREASKGSTYAKSSDLSTTSLQNQPATSPTPSLPKRSLFEKLFGGMSKAQARLYSLVCLLGGFYVGAWFFRMTEVKSVYQENPVMQTFFGFFALITFVTYFIYYLFRKIYKSSDNYVLANDQKAFGLLIVSSLIDLNLFYLDFSYWIKSTNWTLLLFLIILSISMKLYAYSRLFAVKNHESNLYIQRSGGVFARLGDYQFIVYVLSGILMMILSLSALLVQMYDIDSGKFLFGFLMPFSLVYVASLFAFSYFRMDKPVWEKPSVIVKILFPVITIASSIIVIPVAVVFFLIHAFFLFRKIFEFQGFSNPTFTLSQFYFVFTIVYLLAYFVIKVLKPFKLSDLMIRIVKFTVIFHLSYALIGLIFAFAGMVIRINYVGFTNNRILALGGLSLEFISLLWALGNLLQIRSGIAFTEDLKKYNNIYKFLFIVPTLFFAFQWAIVGVVRYDNARVKSILKNSTDVRDFRLNWVYDSSDNAKNTNGRYLSDTIANDISSYNSESISTKWRVDRLNTYLADASNFGQLFIMFDNPLAKENINDLKYSQEVKDFYNKYKDLKGDVVRCREDFKKLSQEIYVKNSKNEIQNTLNTWQLGTYYEYDYTKEYNPNIKTNFWRDCFEADNVNYR